MRDTIPPEWLHPGDMAEAQRAIAACAELDDRFGAIAIVAGADTSMKWRDARGPIHAAIAPMRWPGGDVLRAATTTVTPAIPYIPGFLGFREVPALLAAWRQIAEKPDLIVVDGHGRAHPRRCGIATHFGVLIDMPTIGCAKSILCGRVEGDLADEIGATAPLVDRGERIGMAVRLRRRAAPVYVSAGHRISLDSAVSWLLQLADNRRLPPPIRHAHDAANAARRAAT
jgi:deoxyribonuclease V